MDELKAFESRLIQIITQDRTSAHPNPDVAALVDAVNLRGISNTFIDDQQMRQLWANLMPATMQPDISRPTAAAGVLLGATALLSGFSKHLFPMTVFALLQTTSQHFKDDRLIIDGTHRVMLQSSAPSHKDMQKYALGVLWAIIQSLRMRHTLEGVFETPRHRRTKHLEEIRADAVWERYRGTLLEDLKGQLRVCQELIAEFESNP